MEEVLPNALMMGVDYELFGSLDPYALQPFIKAFSIKQKLADAERWQLGVYIRSAVASTLDKHAKYPPKPIFYQSFEEKTERERMLEIKERFMAHAIMLNSHRRKENT